MLKPLNINSLVRDRKLSELLFQSSRRGKHFKVSRLRIGLNHLHCSARKIPLCIHKRNEGKTMVFGTPLQHCVHYIALQYVTTKVANSTLCKRNHNPKGCDVINVLM
jgi:hypothetical protein